MADGDTNVNAVPDGKGKKALPLAVVAVLMLIEGVGVFFAVKYFMPDPASAMALEGDGGGTGTGDTDSMNLVEVAMAECRPVNKETGKLISIQIRVSALVAVDDLEKAKEAVKANQARIEERINVVIRSAEPQFLNEPGLQTIKRRLKTEFDRLFGEEKLIREVLIPELIQSGSGV